MRKPKKLCFGTAGIPDSTQPRNTLEGVRQVRDIGLDSMEIEFVRSINVRPEVAPQIRESAEQNNVLLSCHGQYYINLASLDMEKHQASINRVINAALRAHACGAWSVTFHAGFYQKRPKEHVTTLIENSLCTIMEALRDVDIWVRPEVSGKISQWGDLDELIAISKKFDNVLPCIDFSHLYARTLGAQNGYDAFRNVLEQLDSELGILDNMHIHAQGIEFSNAGEKRHLMLADSDFDYRGLLAALKDMDVKGTCICEGPKPETDALILQKTFSEL